MNNHAKAQEELKAFEEANQRNHRAESLRELLTPLFVADVDLEEVSFEGLQEMARAVYLALPRKQQKEWDNHSWLWRQ